MTAEKDTSAVEVSAWRMRVGVFFFVLWWIPIYLTVPAIIAGAGLPDTSQVRREVFLVIILIQSVIGILGVLLVGKQVTVIMKGTSIKKMPRKAWHVFIHGELS